MKNKRSSRVRKRRGIEERRFRSALGRRIEGLVRRGKPPKVTDGKLVYRFTTIDHQNSAEGEATREGLEIDASRALAPLQAVCEDLLAQRRIQGRALKGAKTGLGEVSVRLAAFEKRYPRAPELFVGGLKWTGAAVTVFIAALLIPDYALNVAGFEFLAPATSDSGFLAKHLDEVAALTFTAAQGVAAKQAGKHGAWAMSSIVVGVEPDHPESRTVQDQQPATRQGLVVSEWTRRQHAALAAALTIFVVGSIVAIVSQRVGALELTGSLGNDSGGGVLKNDAAKPQKPSATMLTLISALPLMVAAFLSGWIDGPMRSTLRKLRHDLKEPSKLVAKLSAEIDTIDARHAKTIGEANRVVFEKVTDQHLATLEVRYRHEVMREAEPEFFGVYQDDLPTGYPSTDAAFGEPAKAGPGIEQSRADEIRQEHGDLTGDSENPDPATDKEKSMRLTELDVEKAPQNGDRPSVEPEHDSKEQL